MEVPIDYLILKLNSFSWDIEEPLVTLTKLQMLAALKNFIENRVESVTLEKWAEFIECREDIAFETSYKEIISSIVFDLANPDLVGELTKEKAEKLINKLNFTY